MNIIRYATESDLKAIKAIADKHKKELGFTHSGIIKDAQLHNQIVIIEQDRFIRFRLI